MSVGKPSSKRTKRANAEVVFVAVLTISVVGIGGVGVMMGTETTKDTTEQIQSPQFDVDDRSDYEITYEDGPLIDNREETRSVQILHGEETHTVYDSSDDSELQPGETLVTRNELTSTYDVEPGETVEVVWERKNGESEIVDELYIPDTDVYGSTYAAPDGEISVASTDSDSPVGGTLTSSTSASRSDTIESSSGP